MAIRQEGNTYYGLSTDTKPTGAVLNGREFREMDTGKKYLFDEENGEWLEQPEEGGGGGGGVMVVHLNSDTGVLDKTWQEIHDAAITRGAIVVVEFTSEYGQIDTQIIWVARCVASPNDPENPTWEVIDNIDGFHAYASSATEYPYLLD